MNLHFEDAINHKEKVNRLFRTAFPKEERPPVFLLYLRRRQGRASFRAIMDGDTFVGLALVTGPKEVQMLLFFAIEEAFRGKGYGSRVLEMLMEEMGDVPFFLCAEPRDDAAPNAQERINRLAFYAANGFHEVGVHVKEAGVPFTVLSPGPAITRRQYCLASQYFFGKAYFFYLSHT